MARTALRPLSINERSYQRGDTVDTRDLPGRRIDQLLKHGMLKEFDDHEALADLIERIERIEAKLGRTAAEEPAAPTTLTAVPSAEVAVAPPAHQPAPARIKRGGAKTKEA